MCRLQACEVSDFFLSEMTIKEEKFIKMLPGIVTSAKIPLSCSTIGSSTAERTTDSPLAPRILAETRTSTFWDQYHKTSLNDSNIKTKSDVSQDLRC